MKIIVHIGERTLEFPDDTPDDVIEATAKQYIGMNKKPDASMTTPKTGSGLAGMQKALAEGGLPTIPQRGEDPITYALQNALPIMGILGGMRGLLGKGRALLPAAKTVAEMKMGPRMLNVRGQAVEASKEALLPRGVSKPVGEPSSYGNVNPRGINIPLGKPAERALNLKEKATPWLSPPPLKPLGAAAKKPLKVAGGELDRVPVKSSNIRSIGYNRASKMMEVEFNSGGIYQYQNVTPREFKYIKAETPSAGKYFRKKFREKTPFRKWGEAGYPEEWTQPPRDPEAGFIGMAPFDFRGIKQIGHGLGQTVEDAIVPMEQILKEHGLERLVDPIEIAQRRVAETIASGTPRSTAMTRHLSPALRQVRVRANKMDLDDDTKKLVKQFLEGVVGVSRSREGAKDVGKLVAKGIYGSLLGLHPDTFVLNLLQIGNTAVRQGFGKTGAAMARLATPSGRELVRRGGVTVGAPGMAVEAESTLQKVIQSPLRASEYLDRGTAYLAALREKAPKLGRLSKDEAQRHHAWLETKATQFQYQGSPIKSIEAAKELPFGSASAAFMNYPARQLNFIRTITKEAFQGKPQSRQRFARMVLIMGAEAYGGKQVLDHPEYLFPILRLAGVPAKELERAGMYILRQALGEGEEWEDVPWTMLKGAAKFTIPGRRAFEDYVVPALAPGPSEKLKKLQGLKRMKSLGSP